MSHVHRFKPVVVTTYECKCGADGEACESCGKHFDVLCMRSDAEGLYFCPGCYAALQAEAGRAPSAGVKP